MKCYSPFAFTPANVTVAVAVVYLAIFIPLITIHETVPSAPANPTTYHGLNLTEAWLDLAELSNGYHPFESRRNDEIRDWLLKRLEEIVTSNGVGLHTEVQQTGGSRSYTTDASPTQATSRSSNTGVTIFNDLESNFTSTALTSIGVSGRRHGISTYFEGTNVIVYIEGTDDKGNEWRDIAEDNLHTRGGVMINAHFDSVSTGYGATDDGMGVITALQLVRYFTTTDNTPRKGVVVLFNNNEEDGLYGAKAFLSHPMATFVRTFLNLEGAGAGGRATLFRTTDTEVTRPFEKAKHPFGTVVSRDGFEQGFVRSQTDYVVFEEAGFRGLDLAFWEPRSRYHTDQDDAKHTSKASLWHMLSASIETMKSLTSDTSDQFFGPRKDNDHDKPQNGKGSAGVWFDLFGVIFVVFTLRALFAWSLSLLIASPLILMLVTYLLIRQNKYFLFTGSVKSQHENEMVPLYGWRGAFRYPIAFIIATAVSLFVAFLIRKFNPLIIYSSQYAVWTMSISIFFCTFWFIMAGSNSIRPSALHKAYSLIWIYTVGWLFLILVTVTEDRFKVASGYIFVILESTIFLATLVTLVEMFSLPTKDSIVESAQVEQESRDGLDALPQSDSLSTPTENDHDEDATEETPLIGGDGEGNQVSTTFRNGYRRSITASRRVIDSTIHSKHTAYGAEQSWSAQLPSWTWIIQFLIMGPFNLIILGQVGLLLVSATAQTGTDGNAFITPYLILTVFSILMILPITPFIHRFTHRIPTFLFLLFVGTLIYNLVAFPFSESNRYKAYFQQTVDLDSGLNSVTIAGVEVYVRSIISALPSASGQEIECIRRPEIRDGLSFCSWSGLAPHVVPSIKDGIPPEIGYSDWLNYNVTRSNWTNKATFEILGQETRGCVLRFDEPFTAFHVHGAAKGSRADVPESGSDQIKLWHRDWNARWVVDVEWPVSEGKQAGEEGRSGRVVCLWSDHNTPGVIPSLDEAQAFAPTWTSIVKLTDGLVEGSKSFVV